jgi:hypothetical protein
MRTLTDREQRTIRLAGIAIGIYLVLFLGGTGWKRLEKSRSDYLQLVDEAQRVRRELQSYEDKSLRAQKLKDTLRLDLGKLSKATVVAEASAAIQKAASSGGVAIGPIRESPARSSSKELTSMQLEVSGPIQAMLSFLHQLDTLGYPVIIDSLQISSAAGGAGGPGGPMGAMPSRGPMPMPPMGPMGPMGGMGPSGPPGMIKLSLTLIILDFEQWKSEEVRRV